MSFVLSFRKPKPTPLEKLVKYLRDNPGIKWINYIPVENKPIQYLEIGARVGENIIDMAKSYCQNPDSKIHCVDPWMDYDEYPEYKGQQDVTFDIFKTNTSPYSNKIVVHRGFSDDIVPTFENDFFDMVYIDGNHETEYVYRDGLMALQKTKKGGYIIFDDYHVFWSQTIKGIDKFLAEHSENVKILLKGGRFGQVILQKI
jgi:hypothetical protein